MFALLIASYGVPLRIEIPPRSQVSLAAAESSPRAAWRPRVVPSARPATAAVLANPALHLVAAWGGKNYTPERSRKSIEVFWVPGSYDDALGFEVWRCILLKSVEVCAFEGCPNDITVLNISKVGRGLARGCFPSCAGK